MPPKTRQRRNQREVSVHTEHSHAESAVNVQGQDQPQPPPSNHNQEVPPTNLLLELIQNLQQNQSELAEAIKQLKEKDPGTKTPPQNGEENQEKPHQDSGSHEKEATFVTMSDVADLLKQEREKNPKEPRLFVRKPPYPAELLKQPYPEKYIAPTFSRFDGRKGSALVHISKFVDSMGAYAGNGDLCLREFSKSLDDRAYTWYTTLPPGSVKVWEDMVELFCGKYFQAEEKITLVNLHTTKQANGEDLLRYIHRFRDISLDCYANYEECELVGVCIDNMLPEFRAHLENLDISRFGQLLQKARKTALSVKPHTEKPREKKNPPQVLTVSTVNNKRKKSNERSFDEAPPPVPCTLEEMKAILDKWVADGIIKLPEVQKKATEEDKKNPKFCYFHRYVHHSTADCWTLRRKFHEKIQDGTLELPQVQQKVHTDPFLKHKNGAVVSVVIHGSTSDVDADESATASTAMTPTAIKTLQRNPRFRSLFNQLGLNPEARTAATEAIMAIAADSGAHCFTAETHASRAFLETTNAITFTDEDMEVTVSRSPDVLSTSQPQSMRFGPIVAFTRFHVVDSVVPYHILLGRPWLHKHQLIPSTYHQCVKGRLNGKPIRIAANSAPFDQSESHFVEAALYDEITPAGEASLAKPKPAQARVSRNVYASVYPTGASFTACEGARGPIVPNKRPPNQRKEFCSPPVSQ
uniref:Retrotransposon gag domain-containing protein n=1 Tax=Fagus sylvatica TaxID=28930 RepID=A0A2N9H6L3_FAGSY